MAMVTSERLHVPLKGSIKSLMNIIIRSAIHDFRIVVIRSNYRCVWFYAELFDDVLLVALYSVI